MKIVGAVILVLIAFCIIIPLGTLFGAFAGWVIGLTPLGDWILHVFGKPGITMTELGAFLGFVGGFFRSNLRMNND